MKHLVFHIRCHQLWITSQSNLNIYYVILKRVNGKILKRETSKSWCIRLKSSKAWRWESIFCPCLWLHCVCSIEIVHKRRWSNLYCCSAVLPMYLTYLISKKLISFWPNLCGNDNSLKRFCSFIASPLRQSQWNLYSFFLSFSLSILFYLSHEYGWVSGCGSVGRAVASNTRGPGIESSELQNFIRDIFTDNCCKGEIKKKRQGVALFKQLVSR